MSWITRLRNTFNPRRLDADLAEEIRDHIARRARDFEDRGMSREEAQRQASLAFGNITAMSEQSRDFRLWTAIGDTLQDARYAWRGLLRNPVFALASVASLSLAIGANTAIYRIVDAALLRPLPVPQPERLVALATPEGGAPGLPDTSGNDGFSYPLYRQLATAAGSAASLALFDVPNRVDAQAGDSSAPPEDVICQFVSPNAFEVLDVGPAAGALLSPAQDHYPGPRAVAVLSYEYWQRRFGGDPSVLGRTIMVSRRPYSVLGVARAGFSGAEPGKFVDVWLPITAADPGIFIQPEYRPFHLIGRLAPGVTREQLAARLQPPFHRHQDARIGAAPDMPPALRKQLREMTILVHSGASGVSAFERSYSRPLWILLGVAACILLIACTNVASLLLARSTARSTEMALRVSLGARRARLVRQLLTESLLISLLAALGGWLLSSLAAPTLVALVSKPGDPVRFDLALDPQVLFFCIAICGFSTLFFGLLPAWHASGSGSTTSLRHSGGQARRLRLGRLFVSVQVAFSFCLIVGGAGFLFSLRNLALVDTGFDPTGVTVLRIANSPQRDRQLALMQQMQLRTAALPGVQGTATAWMAIFSGGRRAQGVALPGRPPSGREETFYRVSPGYFATLRTPLLEGRDFTFRDDETEPVPTIVNRAFARRYFGPGAALGREFRRDDGVLHQVVGVAANSHYGNLRGGPEPIAYFPMKPPLSYTLYVRSTLDAASVAKMVEREARSLGAGVRVVDCTTLQALVGGTILKEKLLAGIGGAFALLGLLLAAIGLFGLLNYSVARRTREIGIRAALGARRIEIYGLVLRDVAAMIAAGLISGTAGALVLMRISASLLFGVRPADPLVIGASMALFLAAAAIAGGLPARRAAAIDPVAALRHE